MIIVFHTCRVQYQQNQTAKKIINIDYIFALSERSFIIHLMIFMYT